MKFDKYVAAGNDFILMNGIDKKNYDYNNLALKVCDRHFGIGADGLMVCEESQVADIKMLYFNSDGSQGEMCGNGIRAFSKFIYDNEIVSKLSISVETLDGIKYINLKVDNKNKVNEIKVDMGYPSFNSKDIPIQLEKEKVLEEKIEIEGKEYVYSALRVGVPHVVIIVDNINEIDINDLGRKIEINEIFPEKTNVNFIEILNSKEINIYTWERGAGRTLGCGTGSCASVLVSYILNKLENKVKVNTEGGELTVDIEDDYKIFMTGSATHVAVGEFYNL